jgi:L-glyceraldehyde 3-phosphate reductase
VHARTFKIEYVLNGWLEKDLLGTLEELGVGCIAFSPLAQGLLTNKYLNGVPESSRATDGIWF